MPRKGKRSERLKAIWLKRKTDGNGSVAVNDLHPPPIVTHENEVYIEKSNMPSCAIFGCYNYKQQKESKSFFRMPKDKDRLAKWIEACQRKDLDELFQIKEFDYFYNSYVVCSDHFEIQCFRNKNLFSQGLLPGSVPTLLLYNVPIVPKIEIIEETFLPNSCNEKSQVSDSTDVVIDVTSTSNKPKEVSTIDLIEMLRQENSNLKLSIKQYQKKLNNKACLLWKYKKQNEVLKQKLAQNRN